MSNTKNTDDYRADLASLLKELDRHKKDETSWLAWPVGLMIFTFVLATALPLAGWAVTTLWGWFFVPLGLPAITWWHGIGIDLLVTFIATSGIPPFHPDIKTADRLKWYASTLYFRPLMVVFLGWVIHRGFA